MNKIELANELIAKGVEILREECDVLVESEGIKRAGRILVEKELLKPTDEKDLDSRYKDYYRRKMIKNDLKSGKKFAYRNEYGHADVTDDEEIANRSSKSAGKFATNCSNKRNLSDKSRSVHKRINSRAAKNESVDLINEAIELLEFAYSLDEE